MRHQGDAGDQELGARGLHVDGLSPVGACEADAIVGAGDLPILRLGLGDGGLEVDVPQRRGLARVGLAPAEVAQERSLRHPAGAVVDGGVREGPVDRQAQAAPQRLEDLLVLGGELVAQVDEVATRDRAPTAAW